MYRTHAHAVPQPSARTVSAVPLATIVASARLALPFAAPLSRGRAQVARRSWGALGRACVARALRRALAGLMAVVMALGCLLPLLALGADGDPTVASTSAAGVAGAVSLAPPAAPGRASATSSEANDLSARVANGASAQASGADQGGRSDRRPGGPARDLHRCTCTHAVAARAVAPGEALVLETTRVVPRGRPERLPASPTPARQFRPPVLRTA